MAYTVYKEGQGIWARGVMASTVFVVAIYAGFRVRDWLLMELGAFWGFFDHRVTVPFLGWVLDTRLIPVAVLLIGFLGFGVWAYNHPKFVDFLVETENELTTRVTWPTRKELVNASTVVVFTAVLIAVYVLLCDSFFTTVLRNWVYKTFAGMF